MNDFLHQIQDCSKQILALEKERQDIIDQHQDEIKQSICKMMDWNDSDIKRFDARYGVLERRIMVEVFIQNDPYARYVFAIGTTGIPKLRFRESYVLNF